MKNLLSLPGLLLLLFIFQNTACQWVNCVDVEKTPIIAETRKVEGDFQEIELSIPAVVYISQGTPPEIKITAMESVQEEIITEVNNSELEIKYKNCVRNPDSMRIDITTENMKELEINGSGVFIANQPIKTGALELEVNGSGFISLETLNTSSLDNNINGSGAISVGNGKAEKMKIEINGSGKIDAMGLKTLETAITINGSGDCAVHADELLNVTVNGSGDIRYLGEASLKKTINGSGDVVKVD